MISQVSKYNLFRAWTISVLFFATTLFTSLHYLVIGHSDAGINPKTHLQKADHCMICDVTFGPAELPKKHWSISLVSTEIIKSNSYAIVHRVSKIISRQFKRGPPIFKINYKINANKIDFKRYPS
ncbi:MAG: hypothetical protein EOO87_16430 [Pedobacter sp.]|nr:MAG: hypothetical protein EOO87_16430 [Pedobacter sp.]